MFVGEYGKRFILDVGYDVSGATALQIEIERPDDTTETLTATAGNVDTTATDQRGREFALSAYRWIYYDWQVGDLDQAGSWKARAVYTDAEKSLRSKWVCFSVSP